jgi:hypothetical protein
MSMQFGSHTRADMLKPEAYIQENESRLEVRMRRPCGFNEFTTRVLSDAGVSYDIQGEAQAFDISRPRLSTNNVYYSTSYIVTVKEGDVGQVKARITQSLIELGYTLVDKQFPV